MTNETKKLNLILAVNQKNQGAPTFTVEEFNQMVDSLLANPSKYPDLQNDWRSFISSHFTLSDNQISFLENLPRKSIYTIQRAFMAIVRDGGKIYLKKDIVTGDIDVVCQNIAIFRPNINLIVCRFDGFFKHCKWFPRN